MNHRERVTKTIKHQIPDRVPYGELEIPIELIGRYLNREVDNLSVSAEFAMRNDFLSFMDMDLVVVPGYLWSNGQSLFRPQAQDETKLWISETDLFVFGLVNGGFGQTLCTYGLNELMLSIQKEPMETARLIESIVEENLNIAEKLVAAGAQAIIIGDDFAYAKGTFVSPIVLRQILFPALVKAFRKIKSWDVYAFLHVDGNINDVMEDVIGLGIDGLHSIQPTAGMDIGSIKSEYGQKITLMGNLDLELFYSDDSKPLNDEVDILLKVAAPGGGFILSTSSGLEKEVNIDRLKNLKEMVTNKGFY